MSLHERLRLVEFGLVVTMIVVAIMAFTLAIVL